MGTVTRPAAQAAKSRSVHSYLVRAMIATRSPGIRPSLIRPFATASTCWANSAAVRSTQRPSSVRRLITRCSGAACALSNGRSASEPWVTGGTSGGTDTSRTSPSSRTISGSTSTGAPS